MATGTNRYLLIALAVAAFLRPAVAPAAVHTVAQGESITAAIRGAEPGDTIRLTGTEYRENLTIDVPVVLTGEGLPVIRGGHKGHVVHITAPGTILEGVHVSESGTNLSHDHAGILIEADAVEIRNCVVTEPLHGIYVKGGNGIRITDSRVEGRLDLIEADRGNGIHLWNSHGNFVAGNEVSNTRDGIYFSFANETRVERNHIHNVRYGLHYMYSNDNSFTDNRFEHNVAGAALMYSQDIVFLRNTFARCRGFRAYGILLQSMDRVVARSNLILDNSRGIFLNNGDGSLIENNDVVDNDLAIQLNGGCENNRFVRNNFIDNLSELVLDVSDSGTAWADEAGGNYWSAYRGYDLDRDGFGDVPFNIQNLFQVMEGNVPEVRFYVLSPAAAVLEAAETTMPILRLGKAEDPRPHMRPLVHEDVPWTSVAGEQPSRSWLWAGMFLAGSFLPIAVLMRFSRVVRRDRRGPAGARPAAMKEIA